MRLPVRGHWRRMPLGNKEGNIIWQLDITLAGFAHQDRNPRFQFGGFDCSG